MTGDLTEYFMWTEVDPEGGEGVIVALVPKMSLFGAIPLATRRRDIAEGAFATVAKAHQERSGHRVRLRRWTQCETLREIKGSA